jgi:hypothetical protein
MGEGTKRIGGVGGGARGGGGAYDCHRADALAVSGWDNSEGPPGSRALLQPSNNGSSRWLASASVDACCGPGSWARLICCSRFTESRTACRWGSVPRGTPGTAQSGGRSAGSPPPLPCRRPDRQGTSRRCPCWSGTSECPGHLRPAHVAGRVGGWAGGQVGKWAGSGQVDGRFGPRGGG